MKVQRLARLVVAVLGIGVAIGLYVTMRNRPAPGPETGAGPAIDPAATMQAIGSSQTRSRDGNLQFTMEAASSKTYPDGRTVLEGAKFTLEDGTVMTSDGVEAKGTSPSGMPQEAVAKGNVKFQAPDGVLLQAGEATLTEASGQVLIAGPVSFTRGRLSGSGTGGVYERVTGAFKLLADARVVGAPGETGRAIDATSSTLTFNRASQALLLEGKAAIKNGDDTMTADRATLYLTEKQDRFRLIEMRGQSKVTPAPGGQSATPDMQAADIDLVFHQDVEALQRAVLTRDAVMVVGQGAGRRSIAAGTITADTAPDGKTMTALDARLRVRVRTPATAGTPERQISAAALVASGDDARGLTAAEFSGGATLVETIPGARGRGATSERTATGQTLTLKLGGQLDNIEEAQFRDNFTFKDADVTGDADTGLYRAAKGQLVLQSVRGGKRLPHVTRGDVKVDAAEIIELDLNTKDVHARGDVKTVSTGTGGPGAPAGPATPDGALFNGRDPVLGFAAEFWFDGSPKKARYRGAPGAVATLRQGEGLVSAQAITLDDATRDLTAEREVTTVMVFEGGRGRGPGNGRYRVTSDALEYSEKQRTARFSSTPVTPIELTGGDGKIVAQQMVMTLARERRALDRLDARGDVSFALTVGHEGLSDTLSYEAARERYTLGGLPVLIRTKGEKAGTCELWTGARGYFTMGASAPEFPLSENPGGVRTSKEASCTGALRR